MAYFIVKNYTLHHYLMITPQTFQSKIRSHTKNFPFKYSLKAYISFFSLSIASAFCFPFFFIFIILLGKYNKKRGFPKKKPSYMPFSLYLISITFAIPFLVSGDLRGSSMQRTPSHIEALIWSFTTSSGRMSVCWNLVYENSRLR